MTDIDALLTKAEHLRLLVKQWDDDPVDNGYKLYREAEHAAETIEIAASALRQLKAERDLLKAAAEGFESAIADICEGRDDTDPDCYVAYTIAKDKMAAWRARNGDES